MDNYEQIQNELRKSLPFLNNLAIILRFEKVLYVSENWNLQKDLPKLSSLWKSEKIRSFKILGKRYMIRNCTADRLIATCPSADHLVGVKDDEIMIIAQIEADGIIPFTTMELARLLDSFKSDVVKYVDKEEKISNKENKMDLINQPREEKDENKVPFTARLMAYYRGKESERKNPLIIDPLSARLAGNLSAYLKNHIRHSEMDYPIVRSHYIEEKFLKTWCLDKKTSQIVLLGAGLDTRAYRFEPLKINKHVFYELDLPEIINFKQEILSNEKLLCKLIRLPTDLSKKDWVEQLKDSGFSELIPTFWILEGLVYYIELEAVNDLFRTLKELSQPESRLFVDFMQRSRWFEPDEPLHLETTDSFSRHFKWGMDIKLIPEYFSKLGWEVDCSFADEYDQGRDVGQKAMIFIHGKLMPSKY